MTFLSVTNNGAESFSCKYDGILFEFPAGESTPCPIAAAQFIFGLGRSDKQEVMARHGWITHSTQVADGQAKLNSFSFETHKEPEEDLPPLIIDELEKARQTPTEDEEVMYFSTSKTEQRSAPLLTEADSETSSDGLADESVTATSGKIIKKQGV
jgi:hypothetical protein